MTKITRFEDIKAWQNAQSLVDKVYELSGKDKFNKDYALRDQIRRASISIPSNIAEGFSRESNQEFIRFLFIAKGSAAEVQSQLYTAKSQNYLTEEKFDEIYQQLEIISKQLSRFITYLKKAG